MLKNPINPHVIVSFSSRNFLWWKFWDIYRKSIYSCVYLLILILIQRRRKLIFTNCWLVWLGCYGTRLNNYQYIWLWLRRRQIFSSSLILLCVFIISASVLDFVKYTEIICKSTFLYMKLTCSDQIQFNYFKLERCWDEKWFLF